MKSVQEIVNDLKSSPHLKLVVDQLEHAMAEEQKNRQDYYALVHENVKAEFVNGEIIYQSPVRKKHWFISSELSSPLIQYVREHQLGLVAVEKAMVSLSRNDYEPDICFFRKEVADQFSDEQLHFPAPDFVVEITSASTMKIDRNEKFTDYAAHGVQEYWIIDTQEDNVEKYINQEGKFVLLEKLKHGTLASETVSGFSFDFSALFSS
jgi:Uma2 family endonuclease